MGIIVHTHEMCTQVYAKADEQYGGCKTQNNKPKVQIYTGNGSDAK